MMTCPKCGRNTVPGRFCERCGAPLPDDTPPTEPFVSVKPVAKPQPEQTPPSAPVPPLVSPSVPPPQRIERSVVDAMPNHPSLEIDSFCVLFENLPGFLRFRFNSGATAENVVLSLENPLTGVKAQSRNVAYLQRSREINVPVPAQEAGAFVWYVTVSYEAGGRKHRLEGEVQMLVVRPREAQKAADQLTVTITNNIHNGNASDVHVSQRAVEELAHLAQSENPFEELRRIVLGGQRVWSAVSIDLSGAMPTLPVQPAASVCERITLDFGTVKLHFFANRMVRIGRRREVSDIVLRPPEGGSDEPYKAVSRAQCYLGHKGESVVVCDGQIDDSHVARPSSYGTFWNDERLLSDLTLAPGASGVLSFAGCASTGAVALNAKVCRPIRACATCPHANRTWCGDGRRPTLMLTRRDGVAERFVALWSCFPLEEADPSFEGVVIFRKEGGFAWRRGRRCGWLVPGETINTDFGQIEIS